VNIPKLMLITDGQLDKNPTAINTISSACQNGLTAVQLREKHLDARPLWTLANALREITARYQSFFSINDRVDIALAVGADGVHLPEAGLSPKVPKKLKPSLIVGVSVHSLEMGIRAEQEGADYILFGPIFQTASKKGLGSPQGLAALEKMAKSLSIPVIAVGGITPFEAQRCIEAGAHGVAAVGAFTQTQDVKSTVADFLKAVRTKLL
jgi:thiamine-phosphate pyrophosphorylase